MSPLLNRKHYVNASCGFEFHIQRHVAFTLFVFSNQCPIFYNKATEQLHRISTHCNRKYNYNMR